MAAITDEEKAFLKGMVERELKQIEQHEHDFERFVSNAPYLDSQATKTFPFLTAYEKYHQFLRSLVKKL